MSDKEVALQKALQAIERAFYRPRSKARARRCAARHDIQRLKKRKYNHFWMHE